MGNRTFLSVTSGAAEGQYEEVAFETNNFIAPLWFSLVSKEQYQRYREQLMASWQAVETHLDNEELEDLPEWSAFGEALNWHIPWVGAVQQLRQSLPVTLARFPGIGPYMEEWLETLYTHVRTYESPVIHLELAQYFHFSMDPVQYLEEIEQYLGLWWHPDERWFQDWNDRLNAYLLGGEHLPKREGENEEDGEQYEAVATPIIQESHSADLALDKLSSKKRDELYLWLLGVLSAALFGGTWLLTSNKALAVLAFLLPSICIVLRELLIRPKRTSLNRREAPAPSPAASKIPYYNGSSPIKIQGFEANHSKHGDAFIIPWVHIRSAKVIQHNAIELALHTAFQHLYPSSVIVTLDGSLEPEQIVSIINSIANLSRV